MSVDDESEPPPGGPVSVGTRSGPWFCHTRTPVYANPWIQLYHDTVTTPAGGDGIYGVVHFKCRAVGVVAIDAAQHIYLVKQHRYTLGDVTIEIPEGGCAEGEALLACAQRELAEEAGLIADNWQQIQLLHTSNSVTDESGAIFLATGLATTEQALEETEADLEVMRVPFSQAQAMVVRGEITDAMSIIGILRAAMVQAESR